MFEKEAEEYNQKVPFNPLNVEKEIRRAFQKGAEFAYNKAKEDVKHDLMMKLKDEGIVKVLKDSIFCNKKLSSQEQQELCAWIECAMEFGEKLDECAKELEEVNKANEWHYVKDGDLPKDDNDVLVLLKDETMQVDYYFPKIGWNLSCKADVIAWKEIVLPKESE